MSRSQVALEMLVILDGCAMADPNETSFARLHGASVFDGILVTWQCWRCRAGGLDAEARTEQSMFKTLQPPGAVGAAGAAGAAASWHVLRVPMQVCCRGYFHGAHVPFAGRCHCKAEEGDKVTGH